MVRLVSREKRMWTLSRCKAPRHLRKLQSRRRHLPLRKLPVAFPDKWTRKPRQRLQPSKKRRQLPKRPPNGKQRHRQRLQRKQRRQFCWTTILMMNSCIVGSPLLGGCRPRAHDKFTVRFFAHASGLCRFALLWHVDTFPVHAHERASVRSSMSWLRALEAYSVRIDAGVLGLQLDSLNDGKCTPAQVGTLRLLRQVVAHSPCRTP